MNRLAEGQNHARTGKEARQTERRGLTEAQVRQSREKYGENLLKKSGRRSFLSCFVSNLGDPVIRVLLVALAVNLAVAIKGGSIYESIGIAVSVFLATLISTLSEYGGEAAFDSLQKESDKLLCRVRRDGKIVQIQAREIVVGDLLLLRAGDKIPADATVIFGEVGVDQSAMTGESREVTKHPCDECERSHATDPSRSEVLPGGCLVVSGECEAVVCAVGDKTLLGEISREIQEETRESPLKLRLTRLASAVSRLGYIAAAVVALASLFDAIVIDSGFHRELILMKLSDVSFLFRELLSALMLGLTVVVMAVPEGLPMMIAVVLSSNIRRMVRDNVLVRKPVGIEAAGSMNILFTDKTGTLTEGKPTFERYISCTGGDIPSGSEEERLLFLSARFNSSYQPGIEAAAAGGGTDAALWDSFPDLTPPRGLSVSERIEFDSKKKFSAVRLSDGTVLLKGAAEVLLPKVNASMTQGKEARFNSVRFQSLLDEICRAARRVIVVCKGDRMPRGDDTGSLTLLGAALLSDRVRASAADSVRSLREAGIHVVMITGDSPETAREIAAQSGILGGGVDICISSGELARMSDTRVRSLLPKIGVVARALPTDKSRLVRIAQEAEMVVGMTGDGINDAPALRRADIGFAMGGGTAVAKEAGDIIILDNNLSSIAKAVLYGRTIFKSIRKFIVLQLTMNMCAVGISMLGPFIGVDAPVTVVQMLWINIIMDTLGGLAFAGEPALPEYMREKPKRRDEPILNGYMINQIILLGFFTVGLCVVFLKAHTFTAAYRFSPDSIYHLTGFFAMFIFAGVLNCFNARVDSLNPFRGLGRNKIFTLIMAAVAAVQIGFVYLGGTVLRTAPLEAKELLTAFWCALLVFPAELIRKIAWRILRGGGRGY